jgi:hypothetical protein
MQENRDRDSAARLCSLYFFKECGMNIPPGSSSIATPGLSRKGRKASDFGVYIGSWNGSLVEIWEDADGDVGIMDSSGYSLVVHRDSALTLLSWLDLHAKRRKSMASQETSRGRAGTRRKRSGRNSTDDGRS